MLKKIKYSKITIVIFLTVLIWVYADLSSDETWPVYNAVIRIARSTSQNLWASFNDKSSFTIDKIVLKGPASKIRDLRGDLGDASVKLEFILDAEQEGMGKPNEYQRDLLDFLKKSDQIRAYGLTVESCVPEIVNVNVVELVPKTLTVRCFDENGDSLDAECDPSKVDGFVPRSWGREKLTARVTLTPAEIKQARLTAIPRTPYIELAPGFPPREAAEAVNIKMTPEPDELGDHTIGSPTLSVAMSPILQGRYWANVVNLRELLGRSIEIKATDQAKLALDLQLQQQPLMTLYILDSDKDKAQAEQNRRVVYNFPEEFVRKGEIRLKNPEEAAVATFKLIELPSEAISSGGVD